MIPSIILTKEKFIEQYPPSGCGGNNPRSRKNNVGGGASPSIINDIPGQAKSFIVYDNKVLQEHRGDCTYPIPKGDKFKDHRQLQSLEAVFKEISPGKSVFSHMIVSPEDVREIFGPDFRQEMERIQRDILGLGSFKKELKEYSRLNANRQGTSSFTTAGTLQTSPSILSPTAHLSQRIDPEEGEEDLVDLVANLNQRAATLGVHVVEQLFPPVTSLLQRDRHNMLDPPTFGSEENYSFSTMQINISPLTKGDLSSLGYSGETHIDQHDEPMSITLLMCISHLGPETDPGKFYIGETREWCVLKPFSLVLFRGTGPHQGTQAIPAGKPMEKETRINLVLYPGGEFLNRARRIIYPWEPYQLAGYSFFSDGAACFGTEEYHRSWCSREILRKSIAEIKQYGRHVEDSRLQQAFTALTGSTKRYIDRDSDEGKAIKKSITAANDLMKSLVPKFKKPRQRKRKMEQDDPVARLQIQPNPPPEHLSSPSQRVTRSSAVDIEPPVGLPNPRQKVQSSPSVSRSSILTRLPRSRKFSQLKSRASTAKQSGPSVSAISQSSPRRSTRFPIALSNFSDELQQPPRKKMRRDNPKTKADISVSHSDLPNSVPPPEMEEDPTDDEMHDEIAISIGTSTSVVEILRQQPLFDISLMNAALEDIHHRSTLLRSKYTKRAPQLSGFLPKPNAPALPETDGIVLVERLAQLGERCDWFTQKSEHLWSYQRALDEYFFCTLLDVEPLFDLSNLVHIFKDVNQNTEGAGICSRALMDQIVSMVKMMAKCSDDMPKAYTFDAIQILGKDQRFQPKFCASVEVILTPFRGTNPHRHMAHHFREVVFRMFFASPLQNYLKLDKAEKIHSAPTNRTFTYQRRQNGGTTVSLQRFLKLLKLSRIMFGAFGEYKGFFRIPQVSEFLSYAHRTLSGNQIAEIAAALDVGDFLADLPPLYEKMGVLLNEMHNVEQKQAEDNSQPYPTIPPIRRPSRPRRKPAQTSSAPPLTASTNYRRHRTELGGPIERSPIEELVRFITVSALAQNIDGDRDSNEVQYGILIERNPEMYSPFREKNPTYQLLSSTLERNDPLYLSRLMMWRIYAFGLDVQLQKRLQLGVIESVQEFYQTWSNLAKTNDLRITAYGGQYYQNVPQNLEEMTKIWNGGLKLSSAWKDHLPQTFKDAEKSIASAGMPIYTGGPFSRVLLLSDLVRAGIVTTPTDNEMATLLLKAKSGALRGLKALGWELGVQHVADALHSIRGTLNEQLLPSVKDLFYKGKVGVFDVEHILCKVSRKQTRQATKSHVWAGGSEEGGLKRKRAMPKK